jgi:hypothetical protein
VQHYDRGSQEFKDFYDLFLDSFSGRDNIGQRKTYEKPLLSLLQKTRGYIKPPINSAYSTRRTSKNGYGHSWTHPDQHKNVYGHILDDARTAAITGLDGLLSG